jgi:ubiquinone/menaquinone biosynthesis C-methylase UbiE
VRNSHGHPVVVDLYKPPNRESVTYSATMPDPALWTQSNLPKTWVDHLSFASVRGLSTFVGAPIRSALRRSRPVELPAGVPGRESLPDYLLQEFHGMPNGYYSSTVSAGYARGFELVMLGQMKALRDRMAERFAACRAVLDVGCGAGRLAQVVRERGVDDVWGLDPCPYALDVASGRVPGARFVQGIAEDMQFSAGRFDGIGVCFVLHELPRLVVERAVAEFARLIRPGGVLVITEPSPAHVRGAWLEVVRKHGVLGTYFKTLAWLVFEPFLDDWLSLNVEALLARHGFRIEADRLGVPFREIVARRHGAAPI